MFLKKDKIMKMYLHQATANCSERLKGHHILRVQLPIDLHLYTKVLMFHRTEKKDIQSFKFLRDGCFTILNTREEANINKKCQQIRSTNNAV